MKILSDITKQLIEVLDSLPDEYYLKKLAILEHQNIGQHIRHTIEHWQILENNYDSEFVNYADRKRDKNIEKNKQLAINLLNNLLGKLHKEDKSLLVVSLDEISQLESTYFRELDNVAEHIIHHAAIIKMAIYSIDIHYHFPENFGYTPATISYKEQQCAQ